MTREEAITYLKRADITVGKEIKTKTAEALEMAIKSLEQEPSRKFEDYENEIEDLHNRLDIAEYDKERLREDVTNLEAKIKELEQEPILDKIRAEIENHCGLVKENHCKYCYHCNSVMGVREILEIIDKYKTESEGEE